MVIKYDKPLLWESVSEFIQVFLSLVNRKTYCYYSSDTPVYICNVTRDMCREIVIPRFTVFKAISYEFYTSFMESSEKADYYIVNIQPFTLRDEIIPKSYRTFIKALVELDEIRATGHFRKLREVWSRVDIDEYARFIEEEKPELLMTIATVRPRDIRVVDLKGAGAPLYGVGVSISDCPGGKQENCVEVMENKTYHGLSYTVLAEKVFEDFYEKMRTGDYHFRKAFPELW